MVEVLNSTAVELKWQYSESDNKNYSILYLSIPDNTMVVSNIPGNLAGNQTYTVDGLVPFMWYGFRVRMFQLRHVYSGMTTDEIIMQTLEDSKISIVIK